MSYFDPHIGVIATGDTASGKTRLMLSFTYPSASAETKRLVYDAERRTRNLQSPGRADDLAHGLYAFDYFPKGDRPRNPTLKELGELYGKIIPSGQYNFFGLDNLAMFQATLLTAILQDKKGSEDLAKEFGIYYSYDKLFKRAWFPSQNLIAFAKDVLRAFLLQLRDHGVAFVLTTELHNLYDNYGKRADKDGVEQELLGETAKVWNTALRMVDTVWLLDRVDRSDKKHPVVRPLPVVTVDVFKAKTSIPGIPAKFAWTDWSQVWAFMAERKETHPTIPMPSPAAQEFPREPQPADLWAWAREVFRLEQDEVKAVLRAGLGLKPEDKLLWSPGKFDEWRAIVMKSQQELGA